MKIEALRFTDEKYGEQDMSILLIDGKNSLSVGNLCECPEDATIDRDLIAFVIIASLLSLTSSIITL